MRNRLWLIGITFLAAALACSAPGAVIETPTVAGTPQVVIITSTPAAATEGLPPAPTNTPGPTAIPSGGPKFASQISFSTEPNPATGTRTFKTATKQIYAMWDYSGMSSGLTVRREWYLNGALWLKREEAWDFTKYGASGTMKDISIYDMDKGLPTGLFELRLYINDQAQFSGDPDFDFRTFTVGVIGDGPGLGPQGADTTMSPDGKTSATVENGTTLSVLTSGGQKKVLATALEIAGYSWLPDSLHIVYSTKTDDGSGYPWGTHYDLYIINISTGGKTKLNNDKEDLHDPIVSPTGKYIAVLVGNDYGDACGVGRVAAIMEIDPVALTRVALTRIDTYAGIAKPPDQGMPYAENGPDFGMPGVWQSPTTIKVAIRHTCTDGSSDAVYLADVVAKSLAKQSSLPIPQ